MGRALRLVAIDGEDNFRQLVVEAAEELADFLSVFDVDAHIEEHQRLEEGDVVGWEAGLSEEPSVFFDRGFFENGVDGQVVDPESFGVDDAGYGRVDHILWRPFEQLVQGLLREGLECWQERTCAPSGEGEGILFEREVSEEGEEGHGLVGGRVTDGVDLARELGVLRRPAGNAHLVEEHADEHGQGVEGQVGSHELQGHLDIVKAV